MFKLIGVCVSIAVFSKLLLFDCAHTKRSASKH